MQLIRSLFRALHINIKCRKIKRNCSKKITRGEKCFFPTYRSYRNQLIKELLNELRQILKKPLIITFFVHSSHTARLFILTIFFEKVSVTFHSLLILKFAKISPMIINVFFMFLCVRVFLQFRHNVYILSFLCHSAKWVSIFENLES